MSRRKTHKDVEFMITKPNDETASFKRFDEAAGLAVAIAASGRTAYIDAIVSSEAGARWYGGDDAVESYREDPDATVFDRIEIRAESKGRVR